MSDTLDDDPDLCEGYTRVPEWQGPCGCRYTTKQYNKPWFYKPTLYWFGWKTLLPFSLGGDEWCRRTLVIGWNFTGEIVIPLWHCRDKDCEGCSPDMLDGVSETWIEFHENLTKEK